MRRFVARENHPAGGEAPSTNPQESCPCGGRTEPSTGSRDNGHGDVTKAELVDRIATGTGLTKIETEAVVEGFMTTVMQALEAGDSVELRGFGAFRIQHRAARTARNPQTQELMEIDERYVPVFRPSQEFRDIVDASAKERQ
ncbi:MAG: hypothetical protein GVY18_00340 [Bacteroidetes bacterium]|nr:hypothetical protein [Bacteroidota bacterium]